MERCVLKIAPAVGRRHIFFSCLEDGGRWPKKAEDQSAKLAARIDRVLEAQDISLGRRLQCFLFTLGTILANHYLQEP